jgi:ribosomal-protein-alanine N-acetyltransferase
VLSFSIEPMTADDLVHVLPIERASFPTPWSRGAFLYELQQNQVARCWVARCENAPTPAVVGYLCLWEIGPEVHITNLAVHPDWRRQGIARGLLGRTLEDARSRHLRLAILEVRPTNIEALGLYERLGFRVVGRRKGYYVDTGEDALVMEAQLSEVPSGNLTHP